MAAAVELLKAARAKIADPANWTTEVWARNKAGDCVSPESGSACSWCAVGALDAVIPDFPAGFHIWSAAFSHLRRAGDEHFGCRAITDVNDSLGHEAVLRMYDQAIADAEARDA